MAFEHERKEYLRDIRDRRDRFAAAALTGLAAGKHLSPLIEQERIVFIAARLADMQIAELDGAVPRAPEKDARAARALHRIAFEPFGPATADADHVLDLITRFARDELAALDQPVKP